MFQNIQLSITDSLWYPMMTRSVQHFFARKERGAFFCVWKKNYARIRHMRSFILKFHACTGCLLRIITRLTESFTIFLQTCLHLAFSSEHALISYCSVNCPTTFLFPLQKSPISKSILFSALV